MPKRKDKSFELMASIGQAKNVEAPLDLTDAHGAMNNQPQVEHKQETSKKPKVAQSSSKTSARSNIPYIPPSQAVRKQLKRLAFEEETSMTALITEGIDYVFKKRGLKAVDQLTDQ